MALYVPRHFATDDVGIAREIALFDPFATVISFDDDEPWISHIPLAWGTHDDFLAGHVARANGHARLIEQGAPMVAVFHGPHAFVSPTFYKTPEQVPTWNYAVVHVSGRPVVVGQDETAIELTRLARAFESELSLESEQIRNQALGVVAFRLPIEKLEIKLKLSQNKPDSDRHGVISALRSREDADSHAVAAWMERRVQMDSA